jgi:hypothetical protein
LKTQPTFKLSTSEVTSGIPNFGCKNLKLFAFKFFVFCFFGFGFSFVFPQISTGYFEYEFCEHLGFSSCLILLMQADFIIIMIIINFLGSVGWPQKTISFGLNNTQNLIQSNPI